MQEPLLTIVVPIYNESQSLVTFLPRLVDFSIANGWVVILVNDGSSDGSGEILASYEKPPFIKVINHKLNRGYGGALKSGLLAVETSYAVTIDGDGQHNPEDIDPVLSYALKNNADLVVGNRGRWKSASKYRELGKFLIRAFTRLLIPLPLHDLNSGFKLYRTDLAQKYLPLCPNSMAFSDVITLIFINQRNLVMEYPITISERLYGKSIINTRAAFDTVVEILNIAMMFGPLKIFLPLSAMCIIFGIVWGMPFLILGRGVSVGAMLAIVTGLLFFSIGLIASQLAAIRLASLSQK
jgi:glycosyltransferase involved in cell wall biosynthesis